MSNNNTWNILKGTDLISESMNKINENFRILKERDDMDDYKWSSYVESITKELENLKKSINEKNSEISNNLTNMDSKINNIPTVTNIKTQVEQAILNAEDTLANVIQSRAGQYVEEKMGDYAKTSTVDNISTSFEQYKASAAEKTASADRIIANSKFYTVFDEDTEESYLVYLNNSTSQYKNIGQYYDENKGTIDPDNKGISDPDVMRELEQTFKTTSTELTSIHQEVTEGTSTVNIIAAVKQGLADNTGNNAKDISASIFVQANQSGSEIQLNADKLNFKGKAILLEGIGQDPFKFSLSNNSEGTNPTLEINTSNFKLDGDGDVEITGKITATSGKIGNLTINQDGSLTNGNFTLASNGKLTVTGAEISGKITANELVINDSAFISNLATNTAFIDNLKVKHLDGAVGTFSGGLKIPYITLGISQEDSTTSKHIFMGTHTEGNSTYYHWKIVADGEPYIIASNGGNKYDYCVLHFDSEHYEDFDGKRFQIMVPQIFLTNPYHFKISGNPQPLQGDPDYTYCQYDDVHFLGNDWGFSKKPSYLSGDSGSFCTLEFVYTSVGFFAYVISPYQINAIVSTNS